MLVEETTPPSQDKLTSGVNPQALALEYHMLLVQWEWRCWNVHCVALCT